MRLRTDWQNQAGQDDTKIFLFLFDLLKSDSRLTDWTGIWKVREIVLTV